MYLTGDEDYEIPPNQYVKVRFSAGQTRVSFDVNIIDDDLMENSETFRITIYDLSVPYGITLGFYTSAEVTIVDNDSKFLRNKVAYYLLSILQIMKYLKL